MLKFKKDKTSLNIAFREVFVCDYKSHLDL